jgi:hypothetical protein
MLYFLFQLISKFLFLSEITFKVFLKPTALKNYGGQNLRKSKTIGWAFM